MGFDTKKFIKTKFMPREDDVPVPDLKDFFGEDEKVVWKVRGLTGIELGRANEAAARNKNIAAILEGLVHPGNQEKVDSMRALLGVDNEAPEDIAKRIELLMTGSIEPVVDLDLALKICKSFPIEFYQITNRITKLTGQGHVPGKQPPSGVTPPSSQP